VDSFDKLIVIAALSAVVVCLVWEHQALTALGTRKKDVPTDRVNVSKGHAPLETGPAYLLSNLPVSRRSDDVLQDVAEGFAPC
jgi:hypothetical protein